MSELGEQQERILHDVVFDQVGTDFELGSVNKQQWHLAILRSGEGENERALWLDYDSSGNHSHSDGMNLGLFAYGMDFLPDFGYPPVQFGGWDAPRARWYMTTAAHNTVVVDESNGSTGAREVPWDGRLELWEPDGQQAQVVSVNCPRTYPQTQVYQRTCALVDLPGGGVILPAVMEM